MKALIEKAKALFKPKAVPAPLDKKGRVYVGIDTKHPYVGLSAFSADKPEGPAICIDGISINEARMELCGKVIDWSRMAPNRVEAISTGAKVTLSLDIFKSLFK